MSDRVVHVSGENEVEQKARLAKNAVHSFLPTTEQKNQLLQQMAKMLIDGTDALIQANQRDLAEGEKSGLSQALLDRLALSRERIEDMAEGLRQVCELPDPVGEVLEDMQRPNGLRIQKKRVPLGVIGMIYEARPNVTVDAASLCLKAGNAVILRGGSTAIHSNTAIIKVLHQAMEKVDFPVDFIQLIEDTDRKTVESLLTCKAYVDVLIPRGGQSLIQHVAQNATVPVIETGEGNCHVYVHEQADADKARSIVVNAKCQRPSVCNAIETVLLDRNIAQQQLPALAETLKDNGVELRGCQDAKALVPWLKEASAHDWGMEYLDQTLAIKVVQDIEEAIEHIQTYGTHHSESIVTEDEQAAERFMEQIDAAAVYHNASTRFTDGFEFGFGAEIGISTQKLHARGPMGLRELTSNKYYLYGDGQVRA